MFTGIIEEVGKLSRIKRGSRSAVLTIQAAKILSDISIGDSVAVNGVCLTVTSFLQTEFTADVMPETLNRTALGTLHIGQLVNLERAMSANGRFGGHIVTGHIDGTGSICHIEKDDNAFIYTITSSPEILRRIIEKGAVAIDGISLTVTKVSTTAFCVSVIPHTLSHTSLGEKSTGSTVNLENDCIGKYIERLLATPGQDAAEKESDIGITEEYLRENGF